MPIPSDQVLDTLNEYDCLDSSSCYSSATLRTLVSKIGDYFGG